MGDFLSGVFGTDSGVQVNHQDPYSAIAPWQQTAQGLGAQLQNQIAGKGPNPAQGQFLQNSQQIAQQQATNYSQNRAINPALAARMAGNTAANLQQNAASTAGIQQAQQQLASEHLLGNVAAQQQSALNQAGAVNAGVAAGNQQQSGGIVGGLLGGISSGLNALFAHGGMVKGYDEGGMTMMPDDLAMSMSAAATPEQKHGPMSYVGKTLGGIGQNMQAAAKGNPMSNISSFMASMGPGPAVMNEGGKVPALLSPGERYLSPDKAKKVAQGKADPLKSGEKIQGKATVPGDSEANDTVPKALDEGGIVIPRSVLDAENPEKEAQRFVAQEMAKHKKSPEGEFRNALKRAVAGRKNK